jgi:hypothetical protein
LSLNLIGHPQNERKSLPTIQSEKVLITRIYRELKKLNTQINDPMKKWENELNEPFQRKTSKSWLKQTNKQKNKKMLTITGDKGNAN